MPLRLSTPKLNVPSPPRLFGHVELPVTMTAARAARTATERQLTRWRVPTPTLDDALVVVSELVTNGLIHGSADMSNSADEPSATIGVSWELLRTRFADAIRVAVHDRSPINPRLLDAATMPPTPAPEDPLVAFDDESDAANVEHGRGLGIVRELASRIEVTHDTGEGGKTVAAVLLIPPTPINRAA